MFCVCMCWGEEEGLRGRNNGARKEGCVLTALISSRSAARWASNEEDEEEEVFGWKVVEGAGRVDMV